MTDWAGTLQLKELEKQYGLPSGLLSSVMTAESGGNPNAQSPKGALGLFQFMPETAKQYGINPLDPQQAAMGAAKMYGDLLTKYEGDLPSALAGYNWGQGNVDRKGLDAAPKETQGYIEKVMSAIGNTLVSPANASEIEVQELPPLEVQQSQNETQGEVVEVELPDGTIIDNVPVGTTKAQLVEKLKRNGYDTSWYQEETKEDTTKDEGSLLEGVGSALRAFSRGMTFGASDEIEAALASPIIAALSDQGIGDSYDQALRASRSMTEEQYDKYPITSIASDIAGSVATGKGLVKGAQALGNAIPAIGKSVSALSNYAKVNPVKSAAGIGSAAAGARSFAESEGGLENRLESGGTGAALGAVAGGGLSYAGGKIAQRIAQRVADKANIKSRVAKISERYGTKPDAQKTASSPIEAMEATAPIVETSLIQRAGEIFPKTAGQATQNPDLQRLEAEAIAGVISPQAQSAGLQAVATQQKSVKSFLDKIGGKIETGRDINGLVDDVSRTIKDKYKLIKGEVNSAYDLARSASSTGKGVQISRDDIRNGLWKSVGDIRREAQYDVSEMPAAKKVIKRLANYSKSNGNITNTFLGDMENWRKMATNAARDKAGSSEGRFLSQMVRKYDDFMEATAANAADEGDKQAIKAFRDAVLKRAEMGRLFERNKFVEDLSKGTLSVDDARNRLLGTGAIKGKKDMANTLDAIIKAAGDEGQNVIRDLQNAFIKRIAERSQNGYIAGTNETKYALGKMKTELENLFVGQSEFAEKLFGKDSVSLARQAVKELDLMSKKQAATQNYSGSGYTMIRGLLNGILERTPVVKQIATGAKMLKKEAETNAMTKQAVESLSGKVPRQFDEAATSRLWNIGDDLAVAGSAKAVSGGTAKKDEIPTVTIYKKKGE